MATPHNKRPTRESDDDADVSSCDVVGEMSRVCTHCRPDDERGGEQRCTRRTERVLHCADGRELRDVREQLLDMSPSSSSSSSLSSSSSSSPSSPFDVDDPIAAYTGALADVARVFETTMRMFDPLQHHAHHVQRQLDDDDGVVAAAAAARAADAGVGADAARAAGVPFRFRPASASSRND